MRRSRRAAAVVLMAGGVLALSACTPGMTQYWQLDANGGLATAWCYNQTIESLTVTFLANNTEDAAPSQTYTVEGPAVFVKEGQSISLAHVAPGWTTPPPIDLDADWYAISIDSAMRGTTDYAGYIERSDLRLDGWTASPSPGLGVASCELLD